MKSFKLMAIAIGAMTLAACQSVSPTVNNPAAWAQIAAGVGQVVGETSIDPDIKRVSTKLARYCAEVQTAALGVSLFAPAKAQTAAEHARITVQTFCAAPPTSVSTAITSIAAAYAAIEAAKGGGA